MTQAHKGSLLPIKNRVLAADEHTAALFHYDTDEKDVLHGISPLENRSSLLFDGTSQYAECQISDALQMTDNTLTTEAWVYPTQNPASDRGIIAIGVNSNSFYFTINNVLKISAYWYGRGGYIDSTAAIPLNEWTHIAISWTTTDVSFYINGELDSIVAIGGTGVIGATAVRIGGEGNARRFYGNVNDVRIWRTARTQEQIAKGMITVDPNDRNLAAWWRLNEGEGSILRDKSIYEHDAIMNTQIAWSKGNSVFTIRKKEGRFGGGMVVEQGTTNLVPNPTINSYPTYGNGWGTYQTNQYNSNTSFSIGTVESVTNNIVTLNPVGRDIYTYDVLNADTSGGGVVAGRDYFIKKHSANSFSLHAYDGSQDGSKGYRVHDSINNDERIEINATDFPTMWHGSPHKPNSGLVKEVIPNGFSSHGKSHDCLRMYTTHKTEGVVGDYLAYGIVPPVEAGKTYTISFYHRAVTVDTVGRTFSPRFYTPGTSPYWTGMPSLTLSLEWQRYEYTGVATNTGNTNFYLDAGSGVVWDISEIQVEEKPFATSFTDGVRSDGRLVYDGNLINKSEGTISFWLKPLMLGSETPIFTNGGTESNEQAFDLLLGYAGGSVPNGKFYYRRYSPSMSGGSTQVTYNMPTSIIGRWTHIACTWVDGDKMKFYVDGQLANEKSGCAMSDFEGHFALGSTFRSNNNFIMDELRIDRIARDEDEILAWYECNSPFWPKKSY